MTNEKADKKLLNEKETVMFKCDNCNYKWMETRPRGHTIRSGHGTNFYATSHLNTDTNEEETSEIPISCRKCHKADKIRRVAPKIIPSTGVMRHNDNSIPKTDHGGNEPEASEFPY